MKGNYFEYFNVWRGRHTLGKGDSVTDDRIQLFNIR